MFEVKRAYIIILMLLAINLLVYVGGSQVNAQNTSNVHESVKIFLGYDSLLIKMDILNSSEVYDSFVGLVGSIDPGIASFKLSFIKNNNWRNTYSYFLENVWYNDTGLVYVPSSKAELSVKTSSLTADVPSFIGKLSDIFMLSFQYNGKFGNTYKYVSPYSDLVYNHKLVFYMDGLSHAVAKWAPVTRFSNFDYYNITIYIDYVSKTGSLYISFINSNPSGFRTLLGQVDWEPYANDTTPVDFIIYSRYIIVSDVPSFYKVVEFDPINYLLVLNGSVDPPSEKNPLDITLSMDYPILLLSRDFNSTDFEAGKFIEVYLKLENIGRVDIDNIVLKEYPWWDSPGVELISGDVETNVTGLDKGQTRIVKYVVKLTDLSSDIFIGPAEATVKLANNISITYYSQSQFIHANGAFIDLTLNIPNIRAELGESFIYKLVVKNRGRISVDNLIVGEYVIGSLGPGEERIVEVSLTPKSPNDIIVPVGGETTYTVNDTQYSVASPKTIIVYSPKDIYGPSIKVSTEYYAIDSATLNVSLILENIGLVDIPDISVVSDIRPLSTSIEYFSGDFDIDNNILSLVGMALGVGDSITLTAIFNITTDTPFLYPVFKVYILHSNPSYIRESSVDIYYNNSLKIELSTSGDKMVTKYPYYINVSLSNHLGFNIYNYTIKSGAVSEGIDVKYLVNNVSVVSDGASETLKMAITADSEGVYWLNGLKVLFILGGVNREVNLGDINITFLYGLRVQASVEPVSIKEGGSSTLIIKLSSDCPDCISQLKLSIKLPSGLSFENGSSEILKNIQLTSDTLENEFVINGLMPGKYQINVTVSYLFNNQYDVVLGSEDIPPVSLKVEENVLMRYYIYFLAGLVLAVVVAYLLRKMG